MQDSSLTRTLNYALLEIDRTSDVELIRRFIAANDDISFELLVRRHAELVSNVCRSILREDIHAAEDAFQATFIALARQAKVLTECEHLGAWLFRVARHAALRVRKQRSKAAWNPLTDNIAVHSLPPDASIEIADRAAFVAEEVDRLPARFREPIILCFYRGLTHLQASLQLGWSIGTVASRIARAKAKLRARLNKRGVILGASLATAIGLPAAGAANSSLIRCCVLAAIGQNTVHTQLQTLANEVIYTMRRTQRKWLLAAPILAMGLSLGGVLTGGMAKEVAAPKAAETQKVELVDPFKGRNDIVQVNLTPIARAKERAYSQRKLNRIAQAIYTYHSLHGFLPTDILDKDGKPLLSWRVAILPYLDQPNIYKLFKLDEPWDSATNKPLSEIILKLYMSGDFDPKHIGYTSVKRFTGPNTLHRPGERILLPRLPDNALRATLLLAELGTPVPWSKPEDPIIEPAAKDKPFIPKDPPVWTGIYSNVINVAFADTQAASLKPDLSSETVASLIYWKDEKNFPDREKFLAIIPAKEESEDLKELQQKIRQMSDDLVKLSEEETKLLQELAKLNKLPVDPAVQLAKDILELDIQLRQLRSDVGSLKERVNVAKKKDNQ